MKVFAQIAKAAYTPEYAETIAGFRLTHNFFNKGTDTQGIAGVLDEKMLVIAFRGTETTNIADWITDLKFRQQIIPYGNPAYQDRVHRGFMEAYLSVREDIQKAIVATSPYKLLCMTGHSLGGALAKLGAQDIKYNNPHLEIICRVFGCPMVGNEPWVSAYNRYVPDTICFWNDEDVVPKLPPANWGYAYAGKIEIIGKNDPGVLAEKIGDHALDYYITLLGEKHDRSNTTTKSAPGKALVEK